MDKYRLGGTALLALVLSGCGTFGTRGTPQPTEHAQTDTQSRPHEQPQTFRGDGMNQTPTFGLQGGDYAIDWTASDTGGTRVGCYHGGGLYHSDGTSADSVIWNDDPGGGQTLRGTKHLHAVQSGSYYFDMTSGCAWTMTIRPE